MPTAAERIGFSPQQEGTNTVRCPVVVRLLSVCCPIIDRTTNGQQTDNDRTTTSVGMVQKRPKTSGNPWPKGSGCSGYTMALAAGHKKTGSLSEDACFHY